MNISLNREQILDKIHGCWLGKNIGGTMGAPYEGCRELMNISGFRTQKGEVLPNDDLDLQLVWLYALESVGAKSFNANVLADFWLTCITPHWNEYGIAKSNLSVGLLPPLCGEVENVWKNSNGAWIRSEIWACLAPGMPNIAAKYATMDASIDHGLSEGTYAEIFTAVLESMAFFESDIRTLIEKALTYVPADSRLARSIRLVLSAYDNGTPWQETRELIVQDIADIGWFQAPGNLAFMTLGLLYGEGDMLKSLVYAINCGDDTDCTAATCGAILGIIAGAKNISQDLKEHVGDKIVTICINGMYNGPRIPKTCTELADRVMNLIPEVMAVHGMQLQWTDGCSDVPEAASQILQGYVQSIFTRKKFSFEIPSLLHTGVIVEYDRAPRVKPGEDFTVAVTLTNYRYDSRYYSGTVYLPEGWSADYNKSIHTIYRQDAFCQDGSTVWNVTIHVGEHVEATNQISLWLNADGHAVPILIPLVLLG